MRLSIPAPSLRWQHNNTLTWAALVWGLLCVAVCARVYLNPTHGTVFHDYGDAGRAWVQGGDVYQVDRDVSQGDGRLIAPMSGFRYGPLIVVLLVPFSVLPPEFGGVLWRLAGVGSFLGAFAWYLRDGLPGAATLTDRQKGAMWLLLIPLSVVSINNGQANVLMMGLLLGAAAAVVTERWNLAAALLAGACLMKLYPLAVALLMIVAEPRRLAWRFVLAVAIGLAIPFALQAPSYVWHEYANWIRLVGSDSRRDFPLTQGYRDFYLLTRAAGMPLPSAVYLGVQLGVAALVAAVGLVGRLHGWPRQYLVTTLLGLGCAWLAVFGPSIESCTFILIAPALAWALCGAWNPSYPAWSRYALVLVFGLFLSSYMTGWFRISRDWCYLCQPIAALLFLVERLLSGFTNAPPRLRCGLSERT